MGFTVTTSRLVPVRTIRGSGYTGPVNRNSLGATSNRQQPRPQQVTPPQNFVPMPGRGREPTRREPYQPVESEFAIERPPAEIDWENNPPKFTASIDYFDDQGTRRFVGQPERNVPKDVLEARRKEDLLRYGVYDDGQGTRIRYSDWIRGQPNETDTTGVRKPSNSERDVPVRTMEPRFTGMGSSGTEVPTYTGAYRSMGDNQRASYSDDTLGLLRSIYNGVLTGRR